MDSKKNPYGVEQMRHLNDLEHVRRRAGMYIGDLGTQGLHHLVHEVVDNAIDEVMGGHASEITVTVNEDHSITVEDDGRGIPVAVDPSIGKSVLEGVMTTLKYGAKFDLNAYEVSGGLHGIGVKAVNFLSEWCVAEVRRDGRLYRQSYRRGEPTGPVVDTGPSTGTGTKISFLPDSQKFGGLRFEYEALRRRLQDAAFLNPRARIHFTDRRCGVEESFHYERGLLAFIDHLNQNVGLLHGEVLRFSTVVTQPADVRPVGGDMSTTPSVEQTPDSQDTQLLRYLKIEMACQFTIEPEENVRGYANNIFTPDGGVHVNGFRNAVARTLAACGRQNNLWRGVQPNAQDLREGLTAVVSVRLPEPELSAQSKRKLNGDWVEGLVQSAVSEYLKQYWEEHPKTARAIADKAITAAKTREQARRAKRASMAGKAIGGLPGKLRDCTSKDVERRELYLVEGDSAGGSAEGGRLRDYQAILPLRGKIINAHKAQADKVLANEEVQSMIQAIGIGIGDQQNLERLRYGKIIIMTDADVDGSHIRTLLLCFFYRQMYPLLAAGHIYIAQPPLFRVREGKRSYYVATTNDMKQRLLERGLKHAELTRADGRQLKGDELRELCLTLESMETELVESEVQDASHLEKLTSSTLGAELRNLQRLGFIADDLFAEQQLGTETPNYILSSRGQETPFANLRELLPAVRATGERGIQVIRFKGLGEMNAEELRDTTLDPKNRTLVRVSIRDADEADRMFRVLMGDKVEPRREFIVKHALEATHLDV